MKYTAGQTGSVKDIRNVNHLLTRTAAERCVRLYIQSRYLCLSFSGWNNRVDYDPGTGSKQLFPKMHLETCDSPLSSVRATVDLQTSHIGKGCDRETYSEKSLQKLCGMLISVSACAITLIASQLQTVFSVHRVQVVPFYSY